jgi:hypothetical protein
MQTSTAAAGYHQISTRTRDMRPASWPILWGVHSLYSCHQFPSIYLDFLPLSLVSPASMPLDTAVTASLKPCCSAHFPTGAAAFIASVPTCHVTLAAVVMPLLAAVPAPQHPRAGRHDCSNYPRQMNATSG